MVGRLWREATAPLSLWWIMTDPGYPSTIMGSAGRPHAGPGPDELPVDAEGKPIVPAPVSVHAMPGNCRRVFTSFRDSCSPGCIGTQPDGGCLCDIVRAANEQGVEWVFQVKWDEWGNQFWSYDGPPLAP